MEERVTEISTYIYLLVSPWAFCTANAFSFSFLILLQTQRVFLWHARRLTTCRPNLGRDGKSVWSLGPVVWKASGSAHWPCSRWVPLRRGRVTFLLPASWWPQISWDPCASCSGRTAPAPEALPLPRSETGCQMVMFWPFSPFHFFNFKNSEV